MKTNDPRLTGKTASNAQENIEMYGNRLCPKPPLAWLTLADGAFANGDSVSYYVSCMFSLHEIAGTCQTKHAAY
jgi:hypothetical protein